MIDTVFYYVDTFEEYEYRQMVGEIAPHTIVFIGDNKTIYKNGECYSAGGIEEIEKIVRDLFDKTDSPLPIATTERLGGIIVGDILSIDENGVLTVDAKALVEKIMADPEIIEILNQEIVKIEGLHGKDGATPEIIDGLWYINGQSTGVEARGAVGPQGPQGPAGKDGKDGATPEIRNGYWFINGQNTNVRAEGRDGKDGADGKDGKDGSSGSNGNDGSDGNDGSSTISKDIEDAIADLKDRWDKLDKSIEDSLERLFADYTWLKNLKEGDIGSSSNFGKEDVEEYFQILGLWKTDSDGNIYNYWSQIIQKIDRIESAVSLVVEEGGGNYQGLQSKIQQYIDKVDGLQTAYNNLNSTWARKSAEKIIEYMYSGLTQASNQNTTYAELENIGKSRIEDAFAGIRTAVSRTADGSDHFLSKVSLESAIKDVEDNVVSAAMTQLETDLNHAKGGIYAYLEGKYAGIDIAVTKNPDTGVVDSNVIISGDVINFDSGKSRFKGEVEATKFLAGDKNDLNVTTEGNKISFNLGNESRAYFTSEGSGMQLYIKDERGYWRKIDFSKLTLVTNNVGTTGHIDLYSPDSGSSMKYARSIYYNTYGTFYSDQAGQTYVSPTWSTYYIKETMPGVIVCRPIGGNSIASRTELYNCDVYRKVQFGQQGSMTVSSSKRIQIAGTNIWLTSYNDTDLVDISARDIYFGTSDSKLSDVHSNPNESFRVKRMAYIRTNTALDFINTVYGIKDSGQVNPAYKNIFIRYEFT